VCVVDAGASGDSEEQNRKRKHHEISPIKWTSTDAEVAGNDSISFSQLLFCSECTISLPLTQDDVVINGQN